jgi:hypothetical protein
MSKTVRDWLQMEIWSPRTTKRLLKIAGAVLVVGFTAGLVLEYWLNPVERRDVSAMLEQARNVRNSSKASFEQQREKGTEIESQAEGAAWTLRDKRIETAASIALFFATNCKKMELAGSAGAASGKVAAMYQDLAESSCKDYETLDTLTRFALDKNSVSRKDLWQKRTLAK